jgi:hypothetical protein
MIRAFGAHCHKPTLASLLFDHLVGARKQCGRYIEAERLGGFEVDDQLELGGLLDRQVGRSVRAVGD